MGILLYIIATILWIILTPLNWLIVTIKYGLSNGYKFGNVNETINSALGKNQRDGTLKSYL